MQTKFKKYLNLSLLIAMLCLISASVLVTSCKKSDSNGVGDKIELNSFGPMPVARGAELRFIGINLDKVTSISLPGGIEIPAASFVTKTSTLVTITVPQNAVPGLVIVNTPEGNITTKTEIGFSEPISIASFSPDPIKPGQELTITGDYLNLVKSVIFTDRVSVDSTTFISKSRSQIKVIVPAAAQTGKISVSNGKDDPIIVYSTAALNIKLPAITTFLPNPVKAGTNLTIAGTDLDLVKSVELGGNQKVTSFVSQTATQLVFKIPDATKDDTLRLVPASGVKVKSSASLVMVIPTVAVTPTTLKNGAKITVTGTNIDLITVATFGGSKVGTISNQTVTSMDVTLPLDATDGAIVFSTNSGKTVSGAALTFIKPTITLIAPLALTAGETITITGTDLDLVRKIIFGGGLSVDVTPASATSFTVSVPMAAISGTITLVTTNATQVVSTSSLAVAAANKPVVTGMTSSVKPGQLLTITGTKLNLVESIYFDDNIKAVQYGVRNATTIEVYVPVTAKRGKVSVTLNAFDGSVIVSPLFTVSGTDPIVDASLVLSNVDDGRAGTWDGSSAEIGSDATLALDGKYLHCLKTDANAWAWIWGNNWYAFPSVTKADYVFKVDVMLTKPMNANPHFQMEFAGTRVDLGSFGFAPSQTSGGWVTVTYDLSTFSDLPATIGTGGEWGINFWYSDGPTDVSGLYMDNFRYQHK